MTTTADAARALGVSQRRVLALIASGDLSATKNGKSWDIDEPSLEQRVASPRLRGRPKYNEKRQNAIARYTLMNMNTPVLDFVYNKEQRTVPAIELTGSISRAPVGACHEPGKPDRIALSQWIEERYIPENRIGIEELLKQAGCSTPDALLFKTLGLNLTDSFWFKPAGQDIDWHDINYFENEYAGEKSGSGPNSGTPGVLGKWWEHRNGVDYLVKESSTGGREPYAEAAYSALCQRLLAPKDYVPYTVELIDSTPHSVCPSFISCGEELVTMADLMRCYGNLVRGMNVYDAYLYILRRLDITDAEQALAKMIVCDFLSANEDRHEMNLGVVRDAQTGAFLRVTPLFDSGRSFYFGARRKADLETGLYRYTAHPFSEYPTTQLAYVKDYSWFSTRHLDDFADGLAGILAENEEAPAWFPGAAALQFERQLTRVIEMADERS